MEKNKTKNFSKKDILKLSTVGIIAGIISGLFSTGGGMILVPAFVHLLDLDDTKSRGTSVFCILPMVIASGFFYYKNNYIDYPTKLTELGKRFNLQRIDIPNEFFYLYRLQRREDIWNYL